MSEGGDADLPLRVSTLELFFDLVFVFAITQLTGILSHDVTVEDGFRVLLVFGALWWMYGGYVWLANARTPSRDGRTDPDRRSVTGRGAAGDAAGGAQCDG